MLNAKAIFIFNDIPNCFQVILRIAVVQRRKRSNAVLVLLSLFVAGHANVLV